MDFMWTFYFYFCAKIYAFGVSWLNEIVGLGMIVWGVLGSQHQELEKTMPLGRIFRVQDTLLGLKFILLLN